MMIFKFEPIYKERVWEAPRSVIFSEERPPRALIGESWEIVDRKDDNSVLTNTSHRGLTLAALLKSDGKSVMGPNWEPGRPFPLLVKWLDCSKRLSLQVHPPGKIAKKLSGEPKTENWYVAEASSDAGLFIGLKKELPRMILAKRSKKKRWKPSAIGYNPKKATRFWWKAEGCTRLTPAT